jgi:hypothetical protein
MWQFLLFFQFVITELISCRDVLILEWNILNVNVLYFNL